MGNIWSSPSPTHHSHQNTSSVFFNCFRTKNLKVADQDSKEMMNVSSLDEELKVRDGLIKKVGSMVMKAHDSPNKLYISKKISNSSEVVFCFPGFWSEQDWIRKTPFGETKVDLGLLPALQYIGLREIGTVNEAFQEKLKLLLGHSEFKNEVARAVHAERKQVVFAGHSSGGAIAMLAAIWFLEEYTKQNRFILPLCLTFGSPLVGDAIVNHAIKRENWSRYFINFVNVYDVVPRISLTPLSSIQQQLQQVLNYLNPKSPSQHRRQPVAEAPTFYYNVMRNTSSVTSHAACKIMGSTNPLFETLSTFIELSPYRPFGTYIFCAGNKKFAVLTNPDAVLQLLFYSCRLNSLAEGDAIAQRSLDDHLNYKNQLEERSDTQTIVRHLDDLEALPLSSTGGNAANVILEALGICERGKLCLRAAMELEKQKFVNMESINEKKKIIEEKLGSLELYKNNCVVLKLGYYDAFKISKNREDFDANVIRLELAGIWDEIIEMLKRYEIPDDFEGQDDWIKIGTRYRRLVEPLDIANYYRHWKNEDTGPYMGKGRPKRYKCTQRWLEYDRRLGTDSCLESCFWADVEELCNNTGDPNITDKVSHLEGKAKYWIQKGDLDDDVFLDGSTFAKLCRQTIPGWRH